MESDIKDFEYVYDALKKGARLNQAFKGDKHCQLVEDTGMIVLCSLSLYREILRHPDLVERVLPKTEEYRKLRIVVHKDFKDKDYDS